MHKKFFIATAIVLALAAGLAASAATRYGGGYGRHGGMLKRMTRELNLTDAQQTQIKSIMTAEKAKIQPLRQQLRQNEQAENANINGTFDQAQATAFAGKQSQIMGDLIVEKERAKSQIYAVLTRPAPEGPTTHAGAQTALGTASAKEVTTDAANS